MTITRRNFLFGAAAVTTSGCSDDPLIWEKSRKSDTSLFRFTRGGLAGYIDSRGRIVIAPTLHQTGNVGGDDFHDGLARVLVKPNEPWYIDVKGRQRFRARNSWIFSEGLATIDRNRKTGYIDRTGQILIEPVFDSAGRFSEGLAPASLQGKFGYIRKDGQFSIEPRFAWNHPFSEGVARVIDEGPCVIPGEYGCDLLNPPAVVGEPPGLPREKRREMTSTAPHCRYHYIDRTGKRLFRQSFAGAKDFAEGLAPVSDGRLWGYIDRAG